MSITTEGLLSDLAQTEAAEAVATAGESALAMALRRAREDNTDSRSQHHSYNSHSSQPW